MHPEFYHSVVAPGFTNVADPRPGAATMFSPPGANGDAGELKT
jgi:hypothetical protein